MPNSDYWSAQVLTNCKSLAITKISQSATRPSPSLPSYSAAKATSVVDGPPRRAQDARAGSLVA